MTSEGAIRAVGLFINAEKIAENGGAMVFVRHAVALLQSRGVAVSMNAPSAAPFGRPDLATDERALVERADALIVVGGDGTILSAARMAAPRGLPLLGVKLGGFGFLAEVAPEGLPDATERLIRGDFETEERMMIAAHVERRGEVAAAFFALNDMVVTKRGYARLMRLRTLVNNEHLATYLADGLIVATPTGSTAYSLSAGGPILHPRVFALAITPICPHTLNARPVVVDAGDVVTVEVEEDVEEAQLTVDGQIGYPLHGSDRIIANKSEARTRLVRMKQPSFYSLLREKFTWGER